MTEQKINELKGLTTLEAAKIQDIIKIGNIVL